MSLLVRWEVGSWSGKLPLFRRIGSFDLYQIEKRLCYMISLSDEMGKRNVSSLVRDTSESAIGFQLNIQSRTG